MLFALVTVTAATLLVLSSAATAQGRKPRLPPGVDPGGVAVAIASPWGIDYVRPEMAARMARDGEGELLGWDFVDNDRQPFEQVTGGVPKGFGVAVAGLVLAEGGRARIMPLRIKSDTLVLGRMVAVTGQSPSRVLLVQASPTPRKEDWAAFAEAAQHFKDVLIVVPAEPLPGDAVGYPAALGLPNVLAVADADETGRIGSSVARPSADLAVATKPVPVPTGTGGETMMWGPGVAAARVAALAARLLAADTETTGAALKRKILALAQPRAAATDGSGPKVWIAAPDRLPVGR